MNYKHSSVINTDGYYVDFVLVVETDTFDEDGTSITEWVVQHYTLKDGESLVDAPRPHARAHAGDTGIIRYKWDGEQWIEGATEEEITQWEIDNPAPEPVEPEPTPNELGQITNAIEEGLIND